MDWEAEQEEALQLSRLQYKLLYHLGFMIQRVQWYLKCQIEKLYGVSGKHRYSYGADL